MKIKSFLFLISMGILIPNLGSCSAPSVVNKLIISSKDKIEIGETITFKTEIYPTPKSEERIKWVSSNYNIAYIDDEGNLTGVNKGKATIIASIGNATASKNVYIGGYIENPIQDIVIAPEVIKVGEYKQLKVTYMPENATDKDLVWSSSNPRIVSVDKNGIIKGEYYNTDTNTVKITATSKENKKDYSVDVTIEPDSTTSKKTIKSYSAPDCLTHYKEKINSLEDKIDQTKINRDNSKQYINNNFFKYDEDEIDKQIYKVGTDNPFRFKCNIATSSGDDPFKEINDKNPYQEFKLEKKIDDDNYEDVTDLYKDTSYKGNEIQFKQEDDGNIYRLTVKPDSNYYDGVDDTMSSTLEFKVVSGYNAYDFSGLTTIDNWTEEYAREIFKNCSPEIDFMNKNPFVDVWGDYKKKHNIPTNSKATILHNNIAIELDELPDNIVWTEHEVSDYVDGIKFKESKDNFNTFVAIKENIHQEDWKDLPVNVIRAKCMNLMYKSLKDNVVIFQRNIYNTKFNYTLEGNYYNLDCSQIKPITLFDERILPEYQDITLFNTAVIGNGITDNGKTYIKTTSAGENVYDLNRPYYGVAPRYQPSNDVSFIVNNLNAFGNSEKDSTHDESKGIPYFINGMHVSFNNCIMHKFSSIMQIISTYKESINKSKLFDTFAPVICTNSSDITIKDSIIKDGDGGCIKISSDGNAGGDTRLICTNTYMESFISGYEVFNQKNIDTLFTSIMSRCGKECFEKYKNVKFGEKGWYAPKPPRNYIKIENDILYLNLLVSHVVSDDLITSPTNGYFKVDNKEIYDIKKDYSRNGNLKPYLDSSLLVSCCMEGEAEKGIKNKGSARVPILGVVSGEDIETFDKNGYSVRLSDYVNDKDNYDKNYSEIGKNFGNVFRGDHLTYMFDLAGKKHFGFVLGYK